MRVECVICPHHCKIEEGHLGLCKGRMNRDGKIVSENYGKLTAVALDPIEKKPLYHLEVTTLIVPGENDTEEEMEALSGWLAGINPDIPLHISRFFPRWKMQDREATPVKQVVRLAEVARRKLKYVHEGNC